MSDFEKSHVTMTELVLPTHTNALGSIFGGVLMSWIDMAAAISAMRYAQSTVVTASIDALHFIAPIYKGYIVEIKASVNYVGKTSCEIGVHIEAMNPETHESFHCCTSYLTFVALDKKMKPKAMPPGSPEGPVEKRRFKAAELRRKSRLELANKIKDNL